VSRSSWHWYEYFFSISTQLYLMLIQLALAEIVAGLYGAIVVRSLFPSFLCPVANGLTGRTGEDVFKSGKYKQGRYIRESFSNLSNVE
jgi:hypothetical protein